MALRSDAPGRVFKRLNRPNCHDFTTVTTSRACANYANSVHSLPLLLLTLLKLGAKVKLPLCLVKHHAMKTYRGSGGIAPGTLNLGAIWLKCNKVPVLN